MTREVEVLGIEHRRCTGQALQHGRLEIVDHNPPGYPATKVSKGIVMAAEEVFHGLRYGELDVQQTAVAKYHDEEAQTPPGVTDINRTELTPVHLGTFPRRKGQGEERRRAFRWPHDTQVVAQDRDTASVALFAQLRVDLYGAVGVAFKQALDDRFIGIELAGARLRLPLSEVCLCQPVDNRAYIQAKLPCDLVSR